MPDLRAEPGGGPQGTVRLDRWLWAARFFKTRGLAAEACRGGKVDVNREAAKPSHPIRSGDLLRITLPRGRREVKVLALAERRGPAAEARRLYEDLTPPAPSLPRVTPALRPPGLGRPTKRERRRLDRLRSL